MAENFLLTNSTNQTIDLYVTGGACCPPDPAFIGMFVILGAWLLFLYMAETRKDIGYALFMMAISGMAFSNSYLANISATEAGGISVNIPLLMVFISSYEVIMTLLLINEMRQRGMQPPID